MERETISQENKGDYLWKGKGDHFPGRQGGSSPDRKREIIFQGGGGGVGTVWLVRGGL